MHKALVVSLLSLTAAMPFAARAADPAPAPVPDLAVTGNLELSSEYIFRGIGQSNRKPAISGGFDLAHVSGFYAGNWNSSISWLSDAGGGSVSSNIEMDFYAGYKGAITEALTYDVGDLYYYYPGTYPGGFTKPNTNEVYGALIWGPLSFKYSYATTNLFGTLTPSGKKTDGSQYFDLSYSGDIGMGLTLGAHVGRQKVKDYADASYTDYKIGVTKDFSGYGVSLAYVGTNAKGDPGQFYRNAFNKDLGDNRVVVAVAKTF